LRGENEGLCELSVRLGLVGDLANDLDDDVDVGRLGVDIGDADLAVLELELLYPVVDCLGEMLLGRVDDLVDVRFLPSDRCRR